MDRLSSHSFAAGFVFCHNFLTIRCRRPRLAVAVLFVGVSSGTPDLGVSLQVPRQLLHLAHCFTNAAFTRLLRVAELGLEEVNSVKDASQLALGVLLGSHVPQHGIECNLTIDHVLRVQCGPAFEDVCN